MPAISQTRSSPASAIGSLCDQALAGNIETVIRRAGAELVSIDEAGLNPSPRRPDDGRRSRKTPRCAAHPVRHACAQAEGQTFGTVPFGYRRNAHEHLTGTDSRE
jgi:hypothetical protein